MVRFEESRSPIFTTTSTILDMLNFGIDITIETHDQYADKFMLQYTLHPGSNYPNMTHPERNSILVPKYSTTLLLKEVTVLSSRSSLSEAQAHLRSLDSC